MRLVYIYKPMNCCCSVAWLHLTLCDPTNCSRRASLSFTVFWSLLKLMSIESVMPSNHLILCHPLLLLSQHQRLFPVSWPFWKYWSFSFSISPTINIQDWFPLGWTGLISLQSKGLSRVFSSTTIRKHPIHGHIEINSYFYQPWLSFL